MSPHQSDLDLMQRVIARDEGAAEALVRSLGHALYTCSRRLVPGEQAAEDVFQETLLGILQSAERYDGRVSLRAWAFAILRNKAVDALRKSGSDRAISDEDPEAHLFTEGGAWRERVNFSPWDREAELREVIEHCMQGLSTSQREALTLKALEGMDSRAAADALGLSYVNFRQVLHRGRQAIRGCVDGKLGGAA